MEEESEATDSTHPAGNHADWNESFYFNFYDDRNDICGFMRIGLKPNRREKNLFCFFMMPDGSLVGSMDIEEYAGPNLAAKGLDFQRITPERKWKLKYGGSMRRSIGSNIRRQDVSFELEYSAINTTFDYRDCTTENREIGSRIEAAEHTEQFGRIKGILNVGDEKYTIDGLGERDHSWGVTDWLAPTMWIWLSGQFSENLAFNITKLIVGGEVSDAGYLYVDGRNRPIVKIGIHTDYSRTGEPKSLKIWLMEKGGEVHEIHGNILRSTKMPFTSGIDRNVSMMYETLVEFRMAEKVGHGVAEYLVRGG